MRNIFVIAIAAVILSACAAYVPGKTTWDPCAVTHTCDLGSSD